MTTQPQPSKTSLTPGPTVKDLLSVQHPDPADPSAKKPLSIEERKELYSQLRARMSKSKLSVDPPVGWHPYWARKDDSSEMARLDYLGFRIVREAPGQALRYKAQGKRENGTYEMGDVILMEIPEEEYQFYLQENEEKAANMSSTAKNKFIEDAEKQGAPTFAVKRK